VEVCSLPLSFRDAASNASSFPRPGPLLDDFLKEEEYTLFEVGISWDLNRLVGKLT